MERPHISQDSPKGREYHLRVDGMTGMRNKELLYLPEGIEYLQRKFGSEIGMVFGDVAGMGVGNDMLRRPGEDVSAARRNVDDCFALLGSLASKIFGDDMRERPFEVVRAGGDEIIFLAKKGDLRLAELLKRYNEEKERFLTDERIGRDAYEAAKLETNIKAQMKLATKDPEFLELAQKGDMKELDAWLRRQLGGEATPEKRTGDLLKNLARLRLGSVPKEAWLEPLDLYHSPAKAIPLGGSPDRVLDDMMLGIAVADADIAWAKGHPGARIPNDLPHNASEIRGTADKYLTQAKGVERTVRLMQEKERELAAAREEGEYLAEERLKKEIIRLETVDPGTGAIRLDKSANKKLIDLVELPCAVSGVDVMRLDVPYFGVFNNHYDYATADEMMKRLASVYRSFTRAVIVRDGGSLFAIRTAGADGFPASDLEAESNAVLLQYANPEDKEKKTALENEAMVKKAVTRQTAVFGKIKLSGLVQVAGISKDTTLADTLSHVL